MSAEPLHVEASTLKPEELEELTAAMVKELKTVFDPEIPVDIYELGLIYKIDIADNKDVTVDMTLTAPACPVAGEMPGWVKEAVQRTECLPEQDALALDLQIGMQVTATEDAREGPRAFKEKRKPVFKGR